MGMVLNNICEDSRVLVFSIHGYQAGKFWPHMRESNDDDIGAYEGKGCNINIPIKEVDCGDADYMAVFWNVLWPLASQFNLISSLFLPDVIVVRAILWVECVFRLKPILILSIIWVLWLLANFYLFWSHMPESSSRNQVCISSRSLGMVLRLLVNVLWVLSSELTRFIFIDEDYKRPFFTAHVKACFLTVNMVRYLVFEKPVQTFLISFMLIGQKVALRVFYSGLKKFDNMNMPVPTSNFGFTSTEPIYACSIRTHSHYQISSTTNLIFGIAFWSREAPMTFGKDSKHSQSASKLHI